MSETAVHGHQNLSHQARDTFELSEIITIKASAWHKDTELLGRIVSSYRIYTRTTNTSISTCKLELKQNFAYSIANKLGSFNTSKSYKKRGFTFGKLENFLQFFSSLYTSFLVWGKFKLPSAKAAPKFLLAEGERKRLSLPTIPLETVPAHGGEEAARRELPRAAAGQDYSPGWDGDQFKPTLSGAQ